MPFPEAVSTLDHEDILVCEDIDCCLFVDRKSNDKHKNSMTFSGLLNCFDGITGCKDGLIIFLTTNYKCNLDSALLRPGRIDLMEEIHYMKKDTAERMIRFSPFKKNLIRRILRSFMIILEMKI